MSRLVLALLVPLTLAACSQRDICIQRATKDQRIVQQLIAETRANIQRGYGYRERVVPDEILRFCLDRHGNQHPCWITVPRTERRPVALDLEAERRKLVSLETRRDQLQRETATAVDACRAAYPQG